MAHALEMRKDGTAKMAYAGDTPWHGLGKAVSPNLSPKEMQREAEQDYKVLRMPLGVIGKKETRAVTTGHSMLVRSTDAKQLDIVGSGYKVIQPDEIFQQFQEFTDAGHMKMEAAGALDGGRIIWATAKLEGASFDVESIRKRRSGEQRDPGETRADLVSAYFLMTNGYKSGFAFQADLTTIRTVCRNTMRIARDAKAEAGTRFRMAHSSHFDKRKKDQVTQLVTDAMKATTKFKEEVGRLVNTEADRMVQRAFVAELLQPELVKQVIGKSAQAVKLEDLIVGGGAERPKESDADAGRRILDALTSARAFTWDDLSRPAKRVMQLLDEQPGHEMGEGTMWQAVNAVTNYVDHERGRTRDSGLTAAWYGAGNQLKQTALELALEYTERLR